MNFIKGRIARIIESFEQSGVHILPRGELENHLPEYNGNPYIIQDEAKIRTFEQTRDFILRGDTSKDVLLSRYCDLTRVLDKATGGKEVDFELNLTYSIRDFIYNVQSAYNRREITDRDTLIANSMVEWKAFSGIMELLDFILTSDGFTCKVKLKASIDPQQREIVFGNTESAANFSIL